MKRAIREVRRIFLVFTYFLLVFLISYTDIIRANRIPHIRP
ncbi:hypothetical protein [Candidatus Methanodesulfokora washburnensis]|nr:hypothetical protein [Candidatus Methanodesulfokores washburnensis]